jgi:hypothetical protein
VQDELAISEFRNSLDTLASSCSQFSMGVVSPALVAGHGLELSMHADEQCAAPADGLLLSSLIADWIQFQSGPDRSLGTRAIRLSESR